MNFLSPLTLRAATNFGPRAPLPAAVDTRVAEVDFDLTRVIVLLWAAAAFVMALGLLREIAIPIIGTATFLQDLRHVAFDSEHSLPAWFGSLLLATVAVLLGLLAALSHRHDNQNTWHWRVLALVFLLLSMDEGVSFHESTMAPLRHTFGFTGLLHFSWVVIAGPLILLVGLIYVPFVLRLPLPFRTRALVAGSIFVFGAFGLELIGGYFASTAGMDALPYKLEATLEECLEIVGLTLFAAALLAFIAARAPKLTIRLAMRDNLP